MVRFNDDNRATLESLLTALQGGLQGGTGYGILQSVLEQQQAQTQARLERMQAQAQTLTDLAGAGQPLSSANTIADLMSPNKPGVAPKVQSMLDLLYQGEQQYRPGGTGQQGGLYNLPATSNISPLYTNNPAIQGEFQGQRLEQLGELEQQNLEELWLKMTQEFGTFISMVNQDPQLALDPTKKAQRIEFFINSIYQSYPDLIATDAVRFQNIMQSFLQRDFTPSANERFLTENLQNQGN
jgi:hypothetical protein